MEGNEMESSKHKNDASDGSVFIVNCEVFDWNLSKLGDRY